jgi:hypothetical protein
MMTKKILLLAMLLSISGLQARYYRHGGSGFGAGFAGGLFGSALVGAATSRPRREQVTYVTQQEPQKTQSTQDYERALNRSERDLVRTEDELQSVRNKARRQEQQIGGLEDRLAKLEKAN